MNQYFDFSNKQLKFVIFLAILALLLSLTLLIVSYSSKNDNSLSLDIHLGNPAIIPTGTFIIDPNTSPVDSLELLPGIGKILADRIVEYRINNRFETELDITNVKGIGPKLYEKLKPYLKVNRL